MIKWWSWRWWRWWWWRCQPGKGGELESVEGELVNFNVFDTVEPPGTLAENRIIIIFMMILMMIIISLSFWWLWRWELFSCFTAIQIFKNILRYSADNIWKWNTLDYHNRYRNYLHRNYLHIKKISWKQKEFGKLGGKIFLYVRLLELLKKNWIFWNCSQQKQELCEFLIFVLTF